MDIEKNKKNDTDELASQIKHLITQSKYQVAKKINQQLVTTYWKIGELIFNKESTSKISSRKLILELSKNLSKELGRGFSRSNLFNMRLFYAKYSNVQTVPGHLSWSHICELITIEDEAKRSFYEKEVETQKWSIRELKRQINSSLFERLLLSKGKPNKKTVLKLSKEGQIIKKASDILKEPYVLEFLGIPENKPLLEKDLEKKLIKHIEDFLLELGKGFMYVGSQQRITIGNTHQYVDLVFYNKILRAYVLIDLKMNKLTPSHIGQMNAYLNYYKTEVNDNFDNAPIGIILCTAKDEIVAEYALGGLTNQIFTSKYIYYLPNKEELINQLEKIINESN